MDPSEFVCLCVNETLTTCGHAGVILPQVCYGLCEDNDYFGVQYGRECWCLESSDNYTQHGKSAGCTMKCSGDSEEFCGGFFAMEVYENN